MTLFEQLSEALRQTRFHLEWLDNPFYADDQPAEKPKSKRVVRLDSGEPPPKDGPAEAASPPVRLAPVRLALVRLALDKLKEMSLPEAAAAGRQIIRCQLQAGAPVLPRGISKKTLFPRPAKRRLTGRRRPKPPPALPRRRRWRESPDPPLSAKQPSRRA